MVSFAYQTPALLLHIKLVENLKKYFSIFDFDSITKLMHLKRLNSQNFNGNTHLLSLFELTISRLTEASVLSRWLN